jgi:hypothetical protein
MLSVMLYRVSVTTVMYTFLNETVTLDYAKVKLFITMTAATLNLIIIVALNKVSE